MLSDLSFYLLPLISGGIGWFTNWVALRMLFHPRKEKKILFFKIQGIFPKRKHKLAERLAKIVSKELLSVEQIKQKVDTPKTREEIRETLEKEVDTYLRAKISTMNFIVAKLITEKRIEQIKAIICGEVDKYVPKAMDQLGAKIEEVDIHGMVYKKVMNFSEEKLEEMMMEVLRKEFVFIEIAGAVLGFLVGLIQLLLIWLTQ